MNRTVDAVLFDLGGVFTESPFSAAESFGAELGAEPGHVMEIVFGPYHEDTDHPWHRLERGEITLDKAHEEILALGAEEGLDVDLYRVLSAIGTDANMREPVVQRVRRLREDGYRTALITNNAREFRDWWWKELPFDELFDVVVDSSFVGMRKPDPKIFRHTLALLGDVPPERAVLLDDFEGNINAAVRLGIRGILVAADPSEALAELDSLTT